MILQKSKPHGAQAECLLPSPQASSFTVPNSFFIIPMYVRGRPPADLAPRFLTLVNDPKNLPVYVYCHGGRHRTGVMTAIYRIEVEDWDIQRAYAEMRLYGFYKRWGHGPLKAYVFDYYRRLKQGADRK